MVNIRFAEERDLPEIIRLCALHAAYEQADYDATGKAAALKKHFFGTRPAARCLVAETGEKLLGYATYAPQFSTWDADFYYYMDCLFLREEARSQGIGEQLVKRIAAEARKENCPLIQWQTPDFNVRAIKFYKRIGAVTKRKERFFLDVK